MGLLSNIALLGAAAIVIGFISERTGAGRGLAALGGGISEFIFQPVERGLGVARTGLEFIGELGETLEETLTRLGRLVSQPPFSAGVGCVRGPADPFGECPSTHPTKVGVWPFAQCCGEIAGEEKVTGGITGGAPAPMEVCVESGQTASFVRDGIEQRIMLWRNTVTGNLFQAKDLCERSLSL